MKWPRVEVEEFDALLRNLSYEQFVEGHPELREGINKIAARAVLLDRPEQRARFFDELRDILVINYSADDLRGEGLRSDWPNEKCARFIAHLVTAIGAQRAQQLETENAMAQSSNRHH